MKLALVIALTLMAFATSAQASEHKPVLRTITVQPGGPSQRTVTVATAGPRFRAIYVCDLVTPGCVRAHRTSAHIWQAMLTTSDPAGPYNIGIFGRAAGRYLTAQVGDAPTYPDTAVLQRGKGVGRG